MNLIENEYRYNTAFRQFVYDFCRNNGCTLQDAFNDEQVKKKFWIYTEV
ncbi:MAG: hypothetical protein NC489_28945 [Ruminococcus flavefaciens]|nr:hypothetical protein [Ruminococcus flavefaciens]